MTAIISNTKQFTVEFSKARVETNDGYTAVRHQPVEICDRQDFQHPGTLRCIDKRQATL